MGRDGLTLEKMRTLVTQTNMCRADKNCGACRRVNFCSIWNNLWSDREAARSQRIELEAFSDYSVKDLPFLVLYRIDDAAQKTFDTLISYMQAHDLYFNEDCTGFASRTEDSNLTPAQREERKVRAGALIFDGLTYMHPALRWYNGIYVAVERQGDWLIVSNGLDTICKLKVYPDE